MIAMFPLVLHEQFHSRSWRHSFVNICFKSANNVHKTSSRRLRNYPMDTRTHITDTVSLLLSITCLDTRFPEERLGAVDKAYTTNDCASPKHLVLFWNSYGPFLFSYKCHVLYKVIKHTKIKQTGHTCQHNLLRMKTWHRGYTNGYLWYIFLTATVTLPSLAPLSHLANVIFNIS